jgi:hypothetical protein
MATELDAIAVMGVAKITGETTTKIHNAAAKSRQIADDFEGKTFGGQGRVITELILQMCGFFTNQSRQMEEIDKALNQKKAAIENMNADAGKYKAIEEFIAQVDAKAKQDFRNLAAAPG